MQNSFLSPQFASNANEKLHKQNNKPGLYVVATPIGNIFDITLRGLHILNEVDIVFAEDTRESFKLLNFYEINKKVIACHEYNEINDSVTNLIERGKKYALISDAGTPLISDPGYKLINWCIKNAIDVFPVPGASSVIAALSASGMATDNFTFIGFLSAKKQQKISQLKKIKNVKNTTIYFESPKRILNTLKDMMDVFGDRKCCVCKELTKIHECFFRSTLCNIVNVFNEVVLKGEYVIIIDGDEEIAYIDVEQDIERDIIECLKIMSSKDAVSIISDKYNQSKSVVYEKMLKLKIIKMD